MRGRPWIPGFALSLGLLAGSLAQAQDRLFAPDKYLHFTGSMLIGATATHYFGSPTAGFWTAVAVSVAKEAYDRRHPADHTASAKDLLWGVMGAYAGSQGMAWWLARSDGRTTVTYVQRF